MEEPPKKYFRLFPGNEVRLMNAYFVTCTELREGREWQRDCDPLSLMIRRPRAATASTGRKVKGTIHWVAASYRHQRLKCRLYENIVDEEKGVYNEDGSLNLNPNSLTVVKDCYRGAELARVRRLTTASSS